VKPLIRPGDHSRQVADVQARLRALGIEVDDEPGLFGESTARAVRAFQQRRGVLSDGIVGPHTWQELVEASFRLGDRTLYLRLPPLRGDDVQELQARLNALGFDAGREDGIFGHDTDQAVRAFQREYGLLEEDGIFGARSFGALAGLRVDRPQTAASLREELKRLETADVRGVLIALDPGHGGEDVGTHGPSGAIEATICWELGVLLAERLVRVGAKARFTRNEIEAPEASERAARANEMGADLFLSLHLNANSSPAAEGVCTYYFPRSSAGELLADELLSALVALGRRDCRSHARSYPVLKETRMPAVIIEPAFITNPDEEKQLEEPAFRAEIADAIATGIFRFWGRT
jgi:N-acetylmuramoyl-L-alanine amidase